MSVCDLSALRLLYKLMSFHSFFSNLKQMWRWHRSTVGVVFISELLQIFKSVNSYLRKYLGLTPKVWPLNVLLKKIFVR